MRARKSIAHQLVHAVRKPLRLRAAIQKGDHRTRALTGLRHASGDFRPDRALRQRAHVAQRADDPNVGLLAHGRRDDPRAGPQEIRGFLQRAHGGRKPDALQRPAAQVVQAREREHEVRPTLGVDHRVQLVDDDGPRGRQHAPPAPRRQQQVERFGRRDEDMRRPSAHARALALRRVARAHGHPHALRALDALDGTAQVFADVIAQRLERGDVYDAQRVLGGLLARDGVDKPQERAQRLARTRWRADQRMRTGRDGRPAFALHGRGRADGARKPRGGLR